MHKNWQILLNLDTCVSQKPVCHWEIVSSELGQRSWRSSDPGVLFHSVDNHNLTELTGARLQVMTIALITGFS